MPLPPIDEKNSTRDRKEWLSTGLPLTVLLWIVIALIGPGEAVAKGPQLPDPIHACALLPVSEVTALIGAPLDEPRETHKEMESPRAWMSMCNYDSAPKQISLGITLKPHGKKGAGIEAYAAHEAEMQEALGPEYKSEPVAGLGDHAGWDESMKQLTIFQGPLMVIVGVVSPKLAGGPALDFCKQVAIKVLAQCPRP